MRSETMAADDADQPTGSMLVRLMRYLMSKDATYREGSQMAHMSEQRLMDIGLSRADVPSEAEAHSGAASKAVNNYY